MTTEKATDKVEVIEHGPHAALVTFDNERDYSYGWNAYAVKSETGKLLEKCTCELIFKAPSAAMTADLAEHPAFAFMKERYNLDVSGIFKEAIGRLATKPAYVMATELGTIEEAHKAAQALADLYKAGQKAAKSDVVKVPRSEAGVLGKMKAAATALGMTLEEYFERAEKVAAKTRK